MKQHIRFNELPTGAEFAKNGNVYRKQSGRTARIVAPAEYSHRVFYFRNAELCTVGVHSRLDASYFEG